MVTFYVVSLYLLISWVIWNNNSHSLSLFRRNLIARFCNDRRSSADFEIWKRLLRSRSPSFNLQILRNSYCNLSLFSLNEWSLTKRRLQFYATCVSALSRYNAIVRYIRPTLDKCLAAYFLCFYFLFMNLWFFWQVMAEVNELNRLRIFPFVMALILCFKFTRYFLHASPKMLSSHFTQVLKRVQTKKYQTYSII